jgi:hypothetical protein
MTDRRNSFEILDFTVSALERQIVECSDAEILSSCHAPTLTATQVSALIDRRLGGVGAAALPALSRRKVNMQPQGLSRRIEMLRRLAVMRPEVSPRLVAAFSAGRTPSSGEVDALAAELLRLGVRLEGTADDE